MGTVTLLIVAASVLGACIASIGLLKIYNQRPIWHRQDARRSAVPRRFPNMTSRSSCDTSPASTQFIPT